MSISNNTILLNSLLEKANNLPDATGGTDTSDATAVADEIFAGETAYTADGKVTGTFTIDDELITQDDLISQIATLVAQKANPQGGTDTSDATATASDILSGKTAYVGGDKITGTIATRTSSDLTLNGATVTVPAGYYASQATKSVPTVTQSTPSITVSSSGLITASATQSAGYVAAGTQKATKQLTTKSTTTYTPTTSNQTIASGTYLTGVQTIKGDANLIPSNIVSGVSIFGVAGSATTSGGGGGGSVETCTGTLTQSGPPVIPLLDGTVYYVDGSGNFQTTNTPGTITVMKNSILVGSSYGNGQDESGDITSICGSGVSVMAYHVTGDFSLQI